MVEIIIRMTQSPAVDCDLRVCWGTSPICQMTRWQPNLDESYVMVPTPLVLMSSSRSNRTCATREINLLISLMPIAIY